MPGKIHEVNFHPEFIGREKELENLKNIFEEVVKGNGSLVFIAGEAGSGKSRLVGEFSVKVTPKPIFLSYRCSYEEQTSPYQLFIQFLKETLTISLPSPNEEERKKQEIFWAMATELEGILSKQKKAFTKGEKDHLFAQFSDLFIRMSECEPLIIFIDNLQWSDRSSLQLLHHVIKNVRNSRILIIGGYVPEELTTADGAPHPLAEILLEMSQEQLFTTIILERLNLEETEKLIKSILKRDDILDDFISAIFKETQGNPLFVYEIIRQLVREGLINLEDEKWPEKIDVTQIGMPTSIKDAIIRRLKQLDEGTRETLQKASVLGTTFKFKDLQNLTKMGEDLLRDGLYHLTEDKFIYEDLSREGVYNFDHTKEHRIIYDNINPEERERIHREAGNLLTSLYKDKLDDEIYNIATHFHKGKDPKKALQYSLKAGRKAISSYAPSEAINYFGIALDSLSKLPETEENDELKLEVVLNLADGYEHIGEWETTVDFLKKAIDLSRSTGEDIKRAEAHRKIAHLRREQNAWSDANEHYDISLKLSEDIGDNSGVADSYRGMGKISWRLGKFEDAIALTEKCVEYAKKANDMKMIGTAFIELGNIYMNKGNYDKAINHYNESLSILEECKDPLGMGRAYNNLGEVYKFQEDLEKAIQCYENTIKKGEESGDIRLKGYGLVNAGESLARKGELEKALKFVDEALKIFQKLDEKYMIVGCYLVYGLVNRANQNWEKAIDYFKESIDILEKIDIKFEKGIMYRELAFVYKDMKDEKNQIESLNKALEIFEEIDSKSFIKKVKGDLHSIGQKQ